VNKKFTFGVVVLTLAVMLAIAVLPACQAAPAAPATPTKVEPKVPFKLGLLTDISGPAALAGKPFTDALGDYFAYINETQGGVDGHPLELDIVDTKYDVNLAVTGFEKLVNQDKVAWVYGLSSNFMPAIRPLADKYKVCYEGLAEESSLLPVTPDMYVFGGGQTYSDMFRNSLYYLKDNWKKADPPRIGIIGVDAAFSKTAIKTTKWMLANELHWPVVDEEYMAMSATDATSQVTNLKAANCDYIVNATTGIPELVFFKTSKSMGLSDTATIIETFIVAVSAFRALAPDAMDNVISHMTAAAPEMADTVPIINDFAKIAALKRPKAAFDWQVIGAYAVGYGYAHSAKKAIDKYGLDTLTGPKLKDIAEHDMNGYNMDGLGAPLPWSPTNHNGPSDIIIIKTKPHVGYDILSRWHKMLPWPQPQATDPSFWMQ
jgi:branched-chain amino acid transport system substrate-binding protein